MSKKFLIALTIVAVVGATGALAASPASALTVDEIQVQIKALLARVAELTAQLNILQGQSTTPPDTSNQNVIPMRHRICTVLYRNLSQGTQGDDVQSLQEFLSAEGYLSANPTGYFGPMTAKALARWQSSQGVQSVGFVGPITRERIKNWCGGGGGSERFAASPQRGSAPLTVTFKTNVQVANPNVVFDRYSYRIDFGDVSTAALPCTGPGSFCSGPHTITHTYASDGTYKAVLMKMGGFAGTIQAVGTVEIYVGALACTKEYKPVCGAKPIVCITTPCNPIQQTYGNRCQMNADGATFLHEGQCRTDPPICLAVIYPRPICAPGETVAPVDPSSSCPGPWKCVSGNKPPAISGFSGPTTLRVNQTGTWTVHASDPENGPLSYSITWGDEHTMAPMSSYAARDAFVQTTTFTHAYSSAGTYTITIVVRDSSGQEARTSTTVRVGAEITYCTMDAMKCPDGTYVGRTGPNCQFVCPNTVSSEDSTNMPYNCKIWQTHGCSGYTRSSLGATPTPYTGMCAVNPPLASPKCNQYF